MHFLEDLLDDYQARFGHRQHLPEYRQVEFYTRKKRLGFSPAVAEAGRPRLRGALATEMAFQLLEGLLTSHQPALEGLTSWQRYLALPRSTAIDKLVAEVYRILRVHHLALVMPEGRLEVDMDDGLIRIRCVHARCALFLTTTPVGLELLESFVCYYLDAARQPYGDAYLEAMLAQYFVDIVAEIKGFNDEDRILYQFNQRLPINRHFRFDSDNPAYRVEAGMLQLEIGKRYADPLRYPVDFYLVFDGRLHVIPVEALRQGCLPLAELARWQARTEDGLRLPERFRTRFGREENVVGLPMT